MKEWHQLDTGQVLDCVQSSQADGLSEAEAARRLAESGPNELTSAGMKTPAHILWDQAREFMVLILALAAAISALLGDLGDALAIAAIVVLNILLGFSQEYRAERALAVLKKMAVPSVRVKRAAQLRSLPAHELVPGDLLLLEAGNAVAADCRVLLSVNMHVQESALTGESHPVPKASGALPDPALPLGERGNMVYLGTFIAAGRGEAVVVATGMRTELGRIAGMIQSVTREPTPAQRRLQQLGKGLAAAALAIVALIFVLGWLRGENLRLLFLTAVSLGVAAVPEGLPAVMTIALTLGAQRMLRRKALIRKLSAVETLGAVTVICTDKTGTLTENRMKVTTLQLADRGAELAGSLAAEAPAGASAQLSQPGFALLLMGAALCNDASPASSAGESGAAQAIGDPTETALLEAAAKGGLAKEKLERALPRVAEIAFTSERKRMTTVHRFPSEAEDLPEGIARIWHAPLPPYAAFTKGALDELLKISAAVWVNGQEEALSPAWRARLEEIHDRLAADGMRVIGVAFRRLDSLPLSSELETLETSLTLVGMAGIMDPPRAEAQPAVATCKRAGIRPVMITGDHPRTAQHIAGHLGIDGPGQAVSGAELNRISPSQLDELVDSVSVYARVSPEHKLRIVEALQRRGEVAAMTGDGVNDAPALRKANIGVAMGVAGTDVAREAADMVLLDDNFATIVDAVEEGRRIFDNIRKFIKYILATNSGEIWVMLAGPWLGMPLPLLPLQILWMNLVTDGLPALALGAEAPEADTMSRPPRPPGESIFARGLGRHVLWVGMLMALLSLGAGYQYWRAHDAHGQTVLFTTLTFCQMAHVMAIRSERDSLFTISVWSNRPLLGAVILTMLLQLFLIYVPALREIFRTVALPPRDLALTLVLSAVIFAAVEIEKWFVRRRMAATGRSSGG